MSFDVFDYPRTITKIDVTEGYTDQSSGDWVPEVTTSTAIDAHISDFSLKERQYLPESATQAGSRKMTCNATEDVNVGDRVQITEVDSEVTTWRVESLLSESNLMYRYTGTSRQTFLIVQK